MAFMNLGANGGAHCVTRCSRHFQGAAEPAFPAISTFVLGREETSDSSERLFYLTQPRKKKPLSVNSLTDLS